MNPPDIFLISFLTSLIVIFVIVKLLDFYERKTSSKFDVYMPSNPYIPTDDEQDRYVTMPIKMDHFIEECNKFGVSYDSVLNVWASPEHRSSLMSRSGPCPGQIQHMVYILLTPIYFDLDQPRERRIAAHNLTRKILLWSPLTKRKFIRAIQETR